MTGLYRTRPPERLPGDSASRNSPRQSRGAGFRLPARGAAICRLVLCGMLLAAGIRSATVDAQEIRETAADVADQEFPGFRRVYVPERLIGDVLRPGWVPVARTELARLLEAARPRAAQPDAAVLTSARWSARVAGDLLEDGRFHGQVAIGAQPQSDELRVLTLPESYLSWKSLKLDGRPAVWGTLADGRTIVVLPKNVRHCELTGRWELRGRQLPRGVEFDLSLWPALPASIDVLLPPDHVLEASRGEVEGPHPLAEFRPAGGDDSGDDTGDGDVGDDDSRVGEVASGQEGEATRGTMWRIAAGSLPQLQLSVLRPVPAAIRPATVFSGSDITCVVRQEGVQVSADFSLEVLDGETDQLRFELPTGFQVHSVRLSGVPVRWRTAAAGDAPELHVRLPVPIRGPGRLLQIRGEAPLELGGGWKLPVVRLADSVFVGRRIHIQISPPLELHQHSGLHTRQTETVAASDGATTLSFLQTSAAAELTADIGYPRQVAGVRSFELLRLETHQWHVETELSWQVESGSAYHIRTTLPTGWRVTSVQGWNQWPAAGSAGESALSNWTVRQNPDGSQLLSLEFREALSSSRAGYARIRAQRTTAPQSLTDRVPIVQPIGAGTVNTLVAIDHPGHLRFDLLRTGPFQPVDPERPPGFATSLPLWKQVAPLEAAGVRRLLVSTTPDASARFRAQAVRPLIAARAAVSVDLSDRGIRQKWQVTLTDRDVAAETLYVWLTGRLPDLVWHESGTPTKVVPGREVDPQLLGDWKPESAGTLYALDLTQSGPGTLTVEAERTLPVALPFRPALVFVPGVSEFQARVELRMRGTRGVVEPQGLTRILSRIEAAAEGAAGLPPAPTIARESAAEPGSAEAESDRTTTGDLPLHSVNRWRYHSISDSLVIRSDEGRQATDARGGVFLDLHSTVAPEAGLVRHRAVYLIPADSGFTAFVVQSPAKTESVVLLNDQVVFTGDGQNPVHRIPLSAGQPHRVELRFSTRAPAAGLLQRLDVPLPRTPHRVTGIRWQAGPPGGWRLLRGQDGLVASSPPQRIGWFSRLFGPVGRPLETAVFNPFDADAWKRLWSPERPSAQDSAVTIVGPLPRRSISVQFWNAELTWRLALVCLLCAALAGWVMRYRRSESRLRIGALICGVCLSGSCFLPAPGALLCGGILSGILLSACLPRRMVLPARGRVSGGQSDLCPTGSTATLRHLVPALLLAATVLQQGPAPGVLADDVEESPAGSPAAATGPTVNLRDELIVPIDGQRRPSEKLPVAWLHESRLAELQRRAARAGTNSWPEAAIRSVVWTGELPAEGAARLTAEFDVVRLSRRDPTRLSIPIRGGSLAGAQPCLIDGQPGEVTGNLETGELEILLPTLTGSRSAAEAETGASRPAEPSSGGDAPAREPVVAPRVSPAGSHEAVSADSAVRHRITLHLQVPVETTPRGRRFAIQGPAVSMSRLELKMFPGCGSARVSGVSGAFHYDGTTRLLTARPGLQGGFEVQGRNLSVSGEALPEMTVETALLIDVGPGVLTHQARLQFRAASSSIDHVRFRLPPAAALRSVETEAPHRTTVLPPQADGSRIVLVELTEASVGSVVVTLAFLQPRERDSEILNLPVADLLPATVSSGFQLVRGAQLVAVSSSAETPLEYLGGDGDAFTPIPVDGFTQFWGDESLLRLPQSAFRIGGPAALRLKRLELEPERTAELRHTVLVTHHRMELLLEADLTTTTAPAFRHVLDVDPRLRVSAVAVREDDASRLQRWSHDNGRLVLYLTGRTVGTQQIRIRGSLPVTTGGRNRLPAVGLPDGTVGSSRLEVFHSRDVQVRATGAAARLLQAPAETSDTDETDDLSGDGENGRPAGSSSARDELIDDALLLGTMTARGRLPALPEILVTPETEPLTTDTLLQTGQIHRSGRLPLTVRLRISGDIRRRSMLRVRVPPAPEDTWRMDHSGGMRLVRQELRPDGSRILTFDPSLVRTVPVVTLESEVTPRSGLEVLLPEVDEARRQRAVAVLGPDLVPVARAVEPGSAGHSQRADLQFRSDAESDAGEAPGRRDGERDQAGSGLREVTARHLPAWMTGVGLLPTAVIWEQPSVDERAVSWKLTVPARGGPRPSRVGLLLTTLWLGSTGELSGTTELILEPGDASVLTLDWPAGTTPEAARFGRLPIRFTQQSPRQLQLALPTVGGPAVVQITWRQRYDDGRDGQVRLPAVADAAVQRELVLVASPPESSMAVSSAGLRGQTVDVASAVIAALLEAVQSAANDGLHQGDLHQLLAGAIASVEQQSAERGQEPATEGEAALAVQVTQASEQLERLSHTLSQADAGPWPAELPGVFLLLSRPPDDPGFVILLPPDDAGHHPESRTVGVQWFRTGSLRWLAAFLMALVLAFVLPDAVRREWGDVFHRHRLVVIALLCTVWWTMLVGGGAGLLALLLTLVVGCGRVVQRWWRGPETELRI